MQFEFSPNSLDKISSEAAIVFAFSSKEKGKFIPLSSFQKMDKENKGELTRIAKLESFSGKKNEVITVIPQVNTMTSRIIILGLGEKEQFTVNDLREIIGSFVKHMKKRINSASLVLPTKEDIDSNSNEVFHAIVEGFELGSYVFIKYKKEEKVDRNLSTIITLFLAILGFLLLTWTQLRFFVLIYPESILLLIPINIMIGRYFGLRMMEYIRFQPILRHGNK